METTFADTATGTATNPTTAQLVVTYTDWGGRYYSETFIWSGTETENISNPTVGSIVGEYIIPAGVQEFTAKVIGTGAVIGASEEIRVLVVP